MSLPSQSHSLLQSHSCTRQHYRLRFLSTPLPFSIVEVPMARFATFLVLFIVLFSSLSSCLEGRKLHLGAQKHSNKVDPSSRGSLFFSSLPKGPVPSSTPSRKGHATEVDEKLIARHLISTERLLLRSVPSPGAGH